MARGGGSFTVWRKAWLWQTQMTPDFDPLARRAPGAYGLVHIFAGNPLLVLIAFLAALFWGALYLRFRSLLVTITSHFLWDLLIFQILPLARPN